MVDELRRAANLIQRRWCEDLLVRTPKGLTRLREQLAGSIAWLEAHPERPLGAGYRERYRRCEALFDAEDAASGLLSRPRSRSAGAPKCASPQLELLGMATKFERERQTTQT